MVLFLTAITPTCQNRDFFCQLDELEVAFDILSAIVAQGDTLLKAHIVDDNRMMLLPLEAFDGSGFSTPILALEQQWQTELNRTQLTPRAISNRSASTRSASTNWVSHQIDQYERRIRSIDGMVNSVKALQQRALFCLSPGNKSSRVSAHFANLLTIYEQQLDQTKQAHKAALVRLSLLQLRS